MFVCRHQVEGQLQLLAEQLEGCNASAAARCAVLAAGSSGELASPEDGPITVSARRTFAVPPQHDAGVLADHCMLTVCVCANMQGGAQALQC